jgi:predicted DNA-binding transcriptional regulator YafY
MEILSIGKEVKILHPKKLIDEVKIKLQENLNQYI